MHNKDIDNSSKNHLTPTMEDYLEAVFNLAKEKRVVRVRDIAKKLGIKMPAVSNMLKTLSDKGLIDYEKYEYIELTGKGFDVGRYIDQRHQILSRFLTDILKIEFDQAHEDACKMGHAVSATTLNRIVDLMVFVKDYSGDGNGWLEDFDECRDVGQPTNNCQERMEKFAPEYNARAKEMERKKIEGER